MNEQIGPTMADLRATSEAAGKEETIGVGPVSIPDSLDRSQIVTLSGGNEVIIAEFDRWYGSCRDEIARVMTENLSALLPSQRVVSYAWGRRVSLNRQITVDILRLDGVLGKTVILKANWAILEENGTKNQPGQTIGHLRTCQRRRLCQFCGGPEPGTGCAQPGDRCDGSVSEIEVVPWSSSAVHKRMMNP